MVSTGYCLVIVSARVVSVNTFRNNRKHKLFLRSLIANNGLLPELAQSALS